MERSDLVVGRTYRGKRFQQGIFGGNNDRYILRIIGDTVQYESDTVRIGAKYPCVPIDKFLRWVKEDVTALYDKEGTLIKNV